MRGISSSYRVHIWYGKTRLAGLQYDEGRMMIDSVVWAQYINVTDTQTDTQPRRHSKSRPKGTASGRQKLEPPEEVGMSTFYTRIRRKKNWLQLCSNGRIKTAPPGEWMRTVARVTNKLADVHATGLSIAIVHLRRGLKGGASITTVAGARFWPTLKLTHREMG